MDVTIKLSVRFTVSDTGLEDAMAEFDELTVANLIKEIIDKSIACDEITATVDIPTIGIGASADCDGQILVTDDLLGLSVGKLPSFAKRYAALNAEIDKAVGAYAMEVRDRAFPPAKKSEGGTGGGAR